MDGYEVKVSYSPNDECYIAQIVEFTGCAVDGPTPEIALARLHDAKEEWVQLVRKAGHQVPAPRYGRIFSEDVAMAADGREDSYCGARNTFRDDRQPVSDKSYD